MKTYRPSFDLFSLKSHSLKTVDEDSIVVKQSTLLPYFSFFTAVAQLLGVITGVHRTKFIDLTDVAHTET